MPITLPMLACPPAAAGITRFPVLVTPKIDGIRAIVVGGKLLSRTLKPIRNDALRQALEAVLPEGSDGEITFGETFQDCTSAVMTRHGPLSGFTFHMFDLVSGAPDEPYAARVSAMRERLEAPEMAERLIRASEVCGVRPLYPTVVLDRPQLDAYEAEVVAAGGEGVMVRSVDGPYKSGRSTAREGYLIKLKRFSDAEAIITGADELVRADGGHVATGLLGSLQVRGSDGVSFGIGTGFTAADRTELWKRRESLIGQQVKYKSFGVGVLHAPRFPVFLGLRHAEDT